MERDAFHVSYLSDKIPEAVFHGQAVKTVAYLKVSTAQRDMRSQHLAILKYARKHDFRIDSFIEATVWSSANSPGSAGRWVRSSPSLMPSPRPGPRAGSSGARRARWASHGSTARRTTSGASSSWVFPTAIAKFTGVSRTSLYSFMSTRGLMPSS